MCICCNRFVCADHRVRHMEDFCNESSVKSALIGLITAIGFDKMLFVGLNV